MTFLLLVSWLLGRDHDSATAAAAHIAYRLSALSVACLLLIFPPLPRRAGGCGAGAPGRGFETRALARLGASSRL